MKTEQATRFKAIVHQGRLITQSQWDGSAFKAPEEGGFPAPESGEGSVLAEGPDAEGMAHAAT